MAKSSWKMEPFFSFEATFDESWMDWALDSWYITFILSTIYVMLVLPAQGWMEPHKPLKLRLPLIAWNVVIGVFSIIGTIRVLPLLLQSIYLDGFHVSICEARYFTKDYVGIWGILFVFSKVPELVDTLFIILRKQKLIFLHWYHHASTLIFAWRLYSTRSSVAFWFCVMNYFVHSLMYSYYAVRAAGFRVNRKIAMLITSLQLSQMFMGLFAVFYAVYHQAYGHGCETEVPELIFGVVIYMSYMILFAHFFYNTYINPPARARKSDDLADGKKVTEVNGNAGSGDHMMNGMNGHMTNGATNGVRHRVAPVN